LNELEAQFVLIVTFEPASTGCGENEGVEALGIVVGYKTPEHEADPIVVPPPADAENPTVLVPSAL
jgi:hypothetical protein